ncbi:D-aminoacyl-tRNA deacylase [Orrella marina]|uniref:D-aminoacyl-tRNA deacylase n=1 Tax=Orrella marina TaxID=2163011 RepID=A0A2R4XI56_9BURK|nr:D-aminoacyl-tRNA deacylase [Orrella marina]AWB33475.1 D-tyrosyl-tRNA(Tyr) deacylase [Orrella marina]
MRVVIQRVNQASVQVDGEIVAAINQGLLVLVCSQPGDHPDLIGRMLGKVLKLRIFSDETGKMNRSLQDVQGGLLLVSQFTLAADVSKGNRPSFTGALPPEKARQDYDLLVSLAKAAHPVVQCGVFGADMKVSLLNDGPVTIPIEMTGEV